MERRHLQPAELGIVSRLRGARKEPFDVLWVHGYAMVNALHGMMAAKALGIPVLLRAEMWLRDRQRSGPKLRRRSALSNFERAGGRCASDRDAERGVLASLPRRSVPLFLMPYAVDNAYFQQRSLEAAPAALHCGKSLHLEAGRPVILFASKLQNRKRCVDLLDAYKELLDRKPRGPLPYLVIVGDGEERAALERLARANGLTDVRFCGFRNQSELPRFFDLATVFVLPARHEPWGLIVNEVMNAGRAVIVSDDVGAQPDLVTDGVEGCVFPVGDVNALADALERVLADPPTAEAMGRRALKNRVLELRGRYPRVAQSACADHA